MTIRTEGIIQWDRFLGGLRKTKTGVQAIAYIVRYAESLSSDNLRRLLASLTPTTWAGITRELVREVLQPDAADKAGNDAWVSDTYERKWRMLESYHRHRRSRDLDRPYLVRDRLYRMPEQMFHLFQTYEMVKLLTRHIGGVRTVVELGCGSGRNLLLVKRLFPETTCRGFDLTAASVDLARGLAGQLNLDVTFDRCDVLDRAQLDAALKEAATDQLAVLTVYALESLESGVEGVLDALAAARPALVLHVEPLYELHQPVRSLRDIFVRRHLRKGRYVTTLVRSLRALEADGRIAIVDLRRLGIGRPWLEYSVAAWTRGSQ